MRTKRKTQMSVAVVGMVAMLVIVSGAVSAQEQRTSMPQDRDRVYGLPTMVRSGKKSAARMSRTKSSTKSAMRSGKMSIADMKFVKEAAQGGLAEVKLGALAAKQGANADVKAFGQHMVDDHSKGNEKLKQTVSGKGVTLPTDINAQMKLEYASLSKLHGAAFDSKYIKLMREDHQEDIAEFQKEASGGKNAAVKAFASDSLPMLKEHYQRIMSIGGKPKSGTDASYKM